MGGALSAGVKDPKAIGLRRISINDLDWRPSPLPHTDAWRAGELDLPAAAFDWSSDDPAGVIDFGCGQLESGEQVLACLDPARPSERNESADLDG
jgi:hypothetical protein